MNSERIITQGDIRARSRQLKPRPRQNNTFGRGFTCAKALTDIEKVESERRFKAYAGTDKMRQKIRMF